MANNRLTTYPKLYEWFLDRQSSPPERSNEVEMLIWYLCKSLCMDDNNLLAHWSKSLMQFFGESQSTYQTFCEAENLLAEAGLDFMSLATEIAELAVRMDKGEEHYLLLSGIASTCDVPVFRFLAAWTALNCGKLEECIQHCEAVDNPFACIFTLQGQAHLEIGNASEAIECLRIAVELSPKEILALFQLAKAYHVTDQFQLAWETLDQVSQLIPGNPEVLAFFAMIALTEEQNELHLSKAWEGLANNFDPAFTTPYQMGLMLDLAFVSNRQDRLSFLLANAPWQTLKLNKEFMANIPWILKKIEACGWQSLANPLLVRVTS